MCTWKFRHASGQYTTSCGGDYDQYEELHTVGYIEYCPGCGEPVIKDGGTGLEYADLGGLYGMPDQ